MPSLSVMMKPASGQCNMACEYCFYADETRNRLQASYGMMSEETLRNIIRKTLPRAEGSISYAFQGGEPTLRGLSFFEKAMEYEQQYNRGRIRVQHALQTNGLLIDEDWCRFLKKNGFLVGLSVDGTSRTHNAFRHDKGGAPTYERVVRAAKLMDRYQVPYNILTVVSHETAPAVREIYADYRQSGWNYQQYIACLDPLPEETPGRNPLQSQDQDKPQSSRYSLSNEEYGEFLVTLFDLWDEDLQKGSQPYIRQFENYIAALIGFIPEACDQRGNCSVMHVVEADGSVYPCDFYMLDEYRLGNINTDTLAQIDRRREEIGFIEVSRRLPSRCRSCPYYTVCRGGCRRLREYQPGTEEGLNHFCQAYRYFFSRRMDRLEEIADKVKEKYLRK